MCLRKGMVMRVVAMFRVSTERQASEGASLSSQRRLFHELADREGWTVVGEFQGQESATQANFDRAVLQRVLTCIRDESPDAIYVHEQSRLTRGDQLEVAMLMRELTERGTKILIQSTLRDPASLDERFMLEIQSVVDRNESARIKERMSRGKREKAKQGKKASGPAPYGYQNPLPGQSGRGTLEIVEEEARVVRQVFELAAQGKSEREVCRTLDLHGVPSPRGGKWGKSTIARMLVNPVYIGMAASNVWVRDGGRRGFRLDTKNARAILVPNAHPAIVDRATWNAAVDRNHAPCAAQPRMLTGLLWVNGARFAGNTNRGLSFYTHAKGEKGHPWLVSDQVESAVWDAFVSLTTSESFVERLLHETQNSKEQILVAQEIEFLQEKLEKAKRRQDRLVDMRSDGEISKEAFRVKQGQTTSQIEKLEADLQLEQAKLAVGGQGQAERIVKIVQTLIRGRNRLSTAQKSQILRSIVRRIDVKAVHQPKLRRDEKGRVLTGNVPQWNIDKVTMRMALKASETFEPHDANLLAASHGSSHVVIEMAVGE